MPGVVGVLAGRLRGRGELGKRLAHRLEQVREALAMLGRDGDRLAQSERIGFVDARRLRPAFGLVGDENDRLARLAHEVGEGAIVRRHARAHVDEKQHRVRLGDRRLGLRAHAPDQARRGGLFQTGRIDDGKIEIAEPARAFPPVAGDARAIVDQGDAPADQAVEQGRLADIRPADNGEGEGHARA